MVWSGLKRVWESVNDSNVRCSYPAPLNTIDVYVPLHYSKLLEDSVSLGGAEKLYDTFPEAVHGLHDILLAVPPFLQVSDRTDNDSIGIKSAELLDKEYRRGVDCRDVARHVARPSPASCFAGGWEA